MSYIIIRSTIVSAIQDLARGIKSEADLSSLTRELLKPVRLIRRKAIRHKRSDKPKPLPGLFQAGFFCLIVFDVVHRAVCCCETALRLHHAMICFFIMLMRSGYVQLSTYNVAGGCYFFTDNLLERQRTLLTHPTKLILYARIELCYFILIITNILINF
jgi:hypothetical protein